VASFWESRKIMGLRSHRDLLNRLSGRESGSVVPS
jgi:hypothetical protein